MGSAYDGRERAGDDESTRKAFSLVTLPENPHIRDVGCGPGMQTIVIAKLSGGRIIALDNHQPFLDQLKRRTEEAGMSGRINMVKGDMLAPDYPDGSFDLT